MPVEIEYQSGVDPVTPGPFKRLMLSPIGKPAFLMVGIISISWTICTSAPSGYFGLMVLTILASILVGTILFFRLVGRIIAQYMTYRRVIIDRSWLRWIWAGLILFIAWVIGVSGLSLRFGFWISKGSMERFVATIQASPAAPAKQWCGISELSYDGPSYGSGIIALHVNGSGFLNSGYFVYSATSPNLPHFPQPLYGNWWLWEDDF